VADPRSTKTPEGRWRTCVGVPSLSHAPCTTFYLSCPPFPPRPPAPTGHPSTRFILRPCAHSTCRLPVSRPSSTHRRFPAHLSNGGTLGVGVDVDSLGASEVDGLEPSDGPADGEVTVEVVAAWAALAVVEMVRCSNARQKLFRAGCVTSRALLSRAQLGTPETTAHGPTLGCHQLPYGSSTHSPTHAAYSDETVANRDD
jgi:hypothetical protein